MKKPILILGILLILILLASTACAEKTVVSFAKTSGAVTGGFTYTITMKARKAPEQDLEIPLTCKETGESLVVKIPAGEKEGSAQYPTELAERTHSVTFTAESGEAYTVKPAAFSLKIIVLPKAKFYNALTFGYVGKTATVNVVFSNPKAVIKGSTFQLRDQDGNVLDERTWNSGEGIHHFKVPVTKELATKRLFSVWMGDYKISEKSGYGAFADMSTKAVRQVQTDQPLVAITLDCGWYGRQMPLVLPVLKKYDVHCTFFMTGFFIRTFTNRLQQLAVPNKNAVELLGVRPRLFRPPYGDYDQELMALCRAEGMEIILWSVDSHDWDVRHGYDVEKVWKRVTRKIEPGYIILFHLDGKPTPEVLDRLIPYIQDELGYKCVTVSELLASGGMELPPVIEEGTEEFYEEDTTPDVIPAGASEG